MKTPFSACCSVLLALTAFATAGRAADPGASAPPTRGDWANFKGYPFDRRAEVLAALPAFEARVDAQVAELVAERAGLPPKADKKEWDFAMKEMNDSRAYLQSVDAELAQANADTWDQQMDKVGQAWVRTQDAYDKVKHSTTLR